MRVEDRLEDHLTDYIIDVVGKINSMKNLIRRILKEEVEETSGEKHPNAEEIKRGNISGCYTVNPGDQALAIAVAFDITLDDIKSLNGLRGADSIQPGQKLRVKNRLYFQGC